MYWPGDYFVTCDRSGEKVLRSQCVKTWDNLIVKAGYAEARHQLDRPYVPPAEATPRETRPEPDDSFLSYGDVTADDL